MYNEFEEFAAKAREKDFSGRQHAFQPAVLSSREDLISLEDVEAMTLFSPPIQDRSIRLNFFGIDVARSEYLSESGFYDFSQILHFHRGGATVVFNQCQWFVGPILHLKRALERVVKARVNINAYLTPPQARGFHTHVDEHDVFIVQISGSKSWTISGVPPYREGRFHTRQMKKPDTEKTILMNPGDVLYLPEGVAHCARTHGDATSIHLTMGYRPARWHDLFSSAVDFALENHVELLERLPLELGSQAENFAEEVRKRRVLIPEDVSLAAEFAINRISDRTESEMDPLIAAPQKLSIHKTSLRLQARQDVVVSIFAGTLNLRHNPTHRTLGLFLKWLSCWNWIKEAESFLPEEIPGDSPPLVKVKLCEYLLSNGFLEVAETQSASI